MYIIKRDATMRLLDRHDRCIVVSAGAFCGRVSGVDR